MLGSFGLRSILSLVALAILLAGCVAYPAYPYGYYGGPYYGGGVVAFSGWGWHDHDGWRGDWHDHDWHR